MNIVEQKNKTTGEVTYRFRYREKISNGKYKRLYVPKDDHAPCKTRQQAEKILPILRAKFEAREKLSFERKKWHDKFYKFQELVAMYEEYKRPKAPNSYQTNVTYLESYVLHYFLHEKHLPSIPSWKHSFYDFKKWLNRCKSIRKKTPLTYSTKNTIIDTLNSFFDCLEERSVCEPQPRMKRFTSKETGDNDIKLEDIPTEDETVEIESLIRQEDEAAADIYYLLKITGMRVNELLGVSLGDIKVGAVDNDRINRALVESGYKKTYCYINIMSQPKSRERDKEGRITRKPLKHKLGSSMKFGRVVPITDKKGFDIIKKYGRIEKDKLQRGVHTDNPEDYSLLYDSSKYSVVYRLNEQSYEKTDYNYKSLHKLRHYKSLELWGNSISSFLPKTILGHSDRAAEKYNHLLESLKDKRKTESNSLIDFL